MIDLDLTEGVPFDPGYSRFLDPFSPTILAIKEDLKNKRKFTQKRLRFNSLNKVALNLLDNNVSFYLGCILWGAYINLKFKDEPKKIKNNSFLNMKEEDLQKLDYMYELEQILEFIENYPKDTKYYTGKEQSLPEFYRKITLSYKDFVEINNNFLQTETTESIKIPENFKFLEKYSPKKLEDVYKKILEATESGKLQELFMLELIDEL